MKRVFSLILTILILFALLGLPASAAAVSGTDAPPVCPTIRLRTARSSSEVRRASRYSAAAGCQTISSRGSSP